MIGDGQRLRDLYPTTDSLKRALEKAGSVKELCEKLDVSYYSYAYHRRWLVKGKPPTRKKIDCSNVDIADISERIKALESRASEVTVYKLVNPEIYKHGEYDGLEFVGVQRGPTWVETAKAMKGRAESREELSRC